VEMIGERIAEGFQKPISIGQKELTAAVSIGMALYPDDSGDIDGLMRRADEAMYEIKVEGGGLHCP